MAVAGSSSAGDAASSARAYVSGGPPPSPCGLALPSHIYIICCPLVADTIRRVCVLFTAPAEPDAGHAVPLVAATRHHRQKLSRGSVSMLGTPFTLENSRLIHPERTFRPCRLR
jgi:hypothetical protein